MLRSKIVCLNIDLGCSSFSTANKMQSNQREYNKTQYQPRNMSQNLGYHHNQYAGMQSNQIEQNETQHQPRRVVADQRSAHYRPNSVQSNGTVSGKAQNQPRRLSEPSDSIPDTTTTNKLPGYHLFDNLPAMQSQVSHCLFMYQQFYIKFLGMVKVEYM